MGPRMPQDMSESLSTQITLLPKLQPDGSNWSTYQEWVLNTLTSKGLKRHIMGTAWKLVQLTELNGEYFKPGWFDTLSDEELEKLEQEQDLYDQHQATVHDIIYQTVDKSTFLQIKGEMTANMVWKKLTSIHANKVRMYEMDLLLKLQNMNYTEGESVRDHLTGMTELKEWLSKMSVEIFDQSFINLHSDITLAHPYLPTTFHSTQCCCMQSWETTHKFGANMASDWRGCIHSCGRQHKQV